MGRRAAWHAPQTSSPTFAFGKFARNVKYQCHPGAVDSIGARCRLLTLVKVVVGYEFKDGSIKVEWELGEVPNLSFATPIYAEIPGWNQDISSVRLWKDLPQACQRFIKT